MRNDKGYLILFPYGTGIVAGMSDGVDTNREPDKYGAFVDIFHDTSIFTLDFAFLHVFLAGIAFYAFDIRMDGNLLRRLCLHIQDPYQDVVPYTEPFPGVSQPVKGQIPCQNGSLHAKRAFRMHRYPDRKSGVSSAWLPSGLPQCCVSWYLILSPENQSHTPAYY